jgi:hypothetical protein
MKPLYAEDLDEILARGCSTPGCTHEHHHGLVLSPRCHPGAGQKVIGRAGGIVEVLCDECEKPIVTLQLASRSQQGFAV